jgi:hypothetical protein
MSDAVATLDQRPNPFALQGAQNNGQSVQVAMAQSRQAQEVQAAMVVAKRFPRDEASAYGRIIKACQRKGLAEVATYAYTKGGTEVSGPSIRLAEAMAQAWGNLDFGIMELEQKNGESTVMAYCWDLETNTRQSKIFQVPHKIQLSEKRGGGFKELTDPRDIYELVANQGARRVRACILGIIPGDIVEEAVAQCDKTMTTGNTVPLSDRLRKMALTFEEEFSVSIPMLEKRLGHKLDVTSEREFVTLKKIYVSLRDGMSKVEQWFEKIDAVEKAEVSTAQNAPAEAGQAPTPGSPQGGAVPNETLGAEKPKRAKKQEAPAAAAEQPRSAMVETLRQKFLASSISEKEFIDACIKHNVLPPTVTTLTGLSSDLLQILMTDYDNVVQTI